MAAQGHDVTVAGRDLPELERIASDARTRYEVDATSFFFDAERTAAHRDTLGAFLQKHTDELHGAFWCIGHLGDDPGNTSDWKQAQRILDVNLASAVSALGLIAQVLEDRGEGFICAISSVAGDRGRASNYTYGASKAGLTAYLEGLRQRLAPAGVHVTTVKPGFVDTKMTYGREDMFLVASPERVAKIMVQAVSKGRDVVYVPWFWRPASFVLRNIPAPLFKRLRV